MFSNSIMSSAGAIMGVYMTNTTTTVTGDGIDVQSNLTDLYCTFVTFNYNLSQF